MRSGSKIKGSSVSFSMSRYHDQKKPELDNHRIFISQGNSNLGMGEMKAEDETGFKTKGLRDCIGHKEGDKTRSYFPILSALTHKMQKID